MTGAHGAPLDRAALWARVDDTDAFDLVIVGGGATGCGLALDAAARGFRVALFEAEDFAKGTSSRATKLLHGGVRYLAQGDVGLVREALHERTAVLHNAPHLASRLPFVMPGYRWWESGFYGTGLKAYDLLAGSRSLGDTEFLSAARTRTLLPNVRAQGLAGGVRYWDAQFDDARLAVTLARTAAARGAVVLNHAPVTGLLREGGQVRGVQLGPRTVRAHCVVNATGIWVDALRDMDREPGAPTRPPMVAPSQGVHLVVDRAVWPGGHALLVPKTRDGRVLFAVPWLGKTILGTTDTPRERVEYDPLPLAEEVAFILDESARYLTRPPTRADVRSVWVGMRPLVRPPDDEGGDTKALSREHTVLIGRSGLVTVTGGKWTTYRAMAEDVLQRCMARGLLAPRPSGVTAALPLLGAAEGGPAISEAPGAHLYGSEAETLSALPGATRVLWRDPESGAAALTEAMVRFAARHELAASVEDVLARRSRLLFLDAAEAARQADGVAAILVDELGPSFDAAASAASFKALAARYARLP